MEIQIIGQGYRVAAENAAGYSLTSLFADRELHSFTGISAFASVAGIQGLAALIENARPHLEKAAVVVGIDQKGTSREALQELLTLDADTYVFYQPGIAIFHPKIYLFEGDRSAEVIIGSSNLTAQGLFANVEASVHLRLDLALETDRAVVQQLKDQFKGLFDYSDPNLKKLDDDLIAALSEVGLVPTEAERKALQEKSRAVKSESIISGIFPKRTAAGIPASFSGKKSCKTAKVSAAGKGEKALTPEKLVWESGALTARDLNIPKGTVTNPTGSMLFKKGNTEGIDQRHYFRDTVFAALDWKPDEKPQAAHLERATALFTLVVEGKNTGTFHLALTHNTRTDTRAYEQRNSMTQIHWGDAKSLIARENLIGKNARLFTTGNMGEFILEIG